MNSFAANYQRDFGGVWNTLSEGILQQGMMVNPLGSQFEGFKAMGQSMNALLASNQLGFESAMRGVLGGDPNQSGFAKYFSEQKTD
jgi:hypothetical protein